MDEEEFMEEKIEQIDAGLDDVFSRLEDEKFDPDPDRADWGRFTSEVRDLHDAFEREVMAPFESVRSELSDLDREALGDPIARIGSYVAAVLYASSRTSEAIGLLGKMADLASGDLVEELRAAERDPANFALLVRGRLLSRRDEYDAARGVFDRVVKGSREGLLVSAARDARIAAKPLTGAPTLFRFNGFGLGMYGARDHAGATYVSTHCVSALWVPVLPLSAYRVVDHGDEGYGFVSRAPLSAFATWYRRAALAAVVGLVAWFGINSYLDSPSRLAAKAYDRAHSAEKSGDTAAAIAGYEAVLETYSHKVEGEVIADTGVALARLYASQVPDPLEPRAVDHAVRVLRRIEQMPTAARNAAIERVVTDEVASWSQSIGTDTVTAAGANLQLIEAAQSAAGLRLSEKFIGQRAVAVTALGKQLADDWPLEALALYMGEGTSDPHIAAVAAPIVDAIGERYSLIRAAKTDLELWAQQAGKVPELAEQAGAVNERLAAASAELDDAERKTVLAIDDAELLAGFLAKRPDDQEVAVVLASVQASSGDIAAAVTTLSSLGKPGWLIPSAQQLLASLYTETGQLEEAGAMLTRILSFRLPRMQRASHAYFEAAQAEQDRLVAQAQSGNIPFDLQQELSGQSDAKQQEIFQNWLTEKLDSNSQLAALKDEYTRYEDVVPMSLNLGMIKLRRANQTTGDARAALLDEAERAFLAIRQDAEGLPSYHLGLGQVYHRLGRPGDGDAEFQHVLARDDPGLALAVSRSYRELGLETRAKEVAAQVYESGKAPFHYEAASMLGVMSSDLDEAEMWFKRGDQSAPDVRNSLREVQARRFARDGKLAEADRAMAEVAAYHDKQAAHSAVSANNAAIAYMARFQYSGDKKHLVAATRSFDNALRLTADNALLLGNAADLYELVGRVEVIGAWVDLSELQPDSDAIDAIYGTLLSGPMRAQVIERAKKNAFLRKSAALTEQEIVLAPKGIAGYRRLSGWYATIDAVDKLTRVRDAVVRQGAFDTAESDAARARVQSGEMDEEILARFDQYIATARAVADRAGGKAPTRAAAQLLLANALERKARLRDDLEQQAEAVAAFRRAAEIWPQMGAENDLANALASLAGMSAAKSSAELSDLWRAERRIYGASTLLFRATSGEHGPAIQATLRQQPELAEAARLTRPAAAGRPSLGHWLLGHLAGDSELETLGGKWVERPVERLASEIAARLDANDPGAQFWFEYIQNKSSQ